MPFTDIFIRRPVLALVVSVSILLIGLQAGFNLSIRQFPKLTDTSIQITTAYPGANADLIRGFISIPIEQAVASTSGVATLTSTSVQNLSIVSLKLDIDADPDRVMTEVLAKMSQVGDDLPAKASAPQVTQELGSSTALMYLSFASGSIETAGITEFLSRSVKPRLAAIQGVGEAEIIGGDEPALRIWLDPDRMAARGVTAGDIVTALGRDNVIAAAGQIRGNLVEMVVDADTMARAPATFADIVLRSAGVAQIKLGDVAKVEIGPRDNATSSMFDGRKAVFIAIHASAKANPLTVVDKVRGVLPDIRSHIPPQMSLDVAY